MPKCRMPRHSVTQPIGASYRLIPLTRKRNATVDAADFDWLNQWNWCAKWNERPKTFYAVRGIRPPENGQRGKHQKVIKMHREILKCAKGEQADHRNGNGLDNRRENLRKCTVAENNCNRPPQPNNKCGYKGVFFSRKRWVARIEKDATVHYLGSFRNAEAAALMYDFAARNLHGEFAFLNFKVGGALSQLEDQSRV